MAEWDSVPSWTPFEDINGGQQFEKRFSADDLNALAENIQYLYYNRPENDTTAEPTDVVYGVTFYSKGQKKAGTMPMVSTSGFRSITIEKSAEQEVAISYFADQKQYIPDNAGSSRAGTIALVQEDAFLASNIKKGVVLFGLTGSYDAGSNVEELPDYTDSDFTLHYYSKGAGELGIVYESSQKVSFDAAPNGAEIDSLWDGNFVPRNIRRGTTIFGLEGDYGGEAEMFDGTINIIVGFTIGGITYQCKEGMNWYNWCNSEYNTADFVCESLHAPVFFDSSYTKLVTKYDGFAIEGGVEIDADDYILTAKE
jgi:hypothetical protein